MSFIIIKKDHRNFTACISTVFNRPMLRVSQPFKGNGEGAFDLIRVDPEIVRPWNLANEQADNIPCNNFYFAQMSINPDLSGKIPTSSTSPEGRFLEDPDLLDPLRRPKRDLPTVLHQIIGAIRQENVPISLILKKWDHHCRLSQFDVMKKRGRHCGVGFL